jgi:hypothetical protein
MKDISMNTSKAATYDGAWELADYSLESARKTCICLENSLTEKTSFTKKRERIEADDREVFALPYFRSL